MNTPKFLLVDYENTRLAGLDAIDNSTDQGSGWLIKVFLGTDQSSLLLEKARLLPLFGPDIEFVRLNANRHNSINYLIAFYLGRLAAENPLAQFRLLSADAKLDPLLQHMRLHGVDCRREATVARAVTPLSS